VRSSWRLLGLGIGADTAIFGVVDAVLLRSLPYRNPESLVVVFVDGTARGQGGRAARADADARDARPTAGLRGWS